MGDSNLKLDKVLSLINNIRTAKSPEGENKPHKYLMLLSIVSILEDNPFHDNKFTYDELESRFMRLGDTYKGNQHMLLLEYPFYHLQSDGIITFQLKPGMKKKFQEYEKTRLTKKRLCETVEHIRLNDDIFLVLKDIKTRKIVNQKLADILANIDVKDDIRTSDFVTYLNTLSNVTANNENAITELNVQHPMFERIKVNNPITDEVWNQIQNGRHVVLTGNAGDGKTMIAAEILAKFGKASEVIRKRIEVPEADLVIVKDMSELNLDEKGALWQEIKEAGEKRYLIVTNTGALLNSIRDIDLPWQKSDILSALSAEGPYLLGDNLVIINIGQVDSIDTALSVFEKMIEERNWTECSSCNCKDRCIIFDNVSLLQANRSTVLERLRLIYKRVYYYGTRLTMRQMTAHLAYAVTGLHSCEEMQTKLELDSKGRFFNWIFGDDGFNDIPEAQQLKGVQALLNNNEIATKTHPLLEAEIWEQNKLSFFNEPNLRMLAETLMAKALESSSEASWKYRRQLRRLIYFCVPDENAVVKQFVSMFLDSPTISEYLDILDKLSLSRKTNLKLRILMVLQEVFSGIRIPRNQLGALNEIYISLSVPYLQTKSQYVMAKMNVEDFDLKVVEKYKAGRVANKIVQLFYKRFDGCSLDIDLPFFDFVEKRYDGELSSQLSAHYVNRISALKNNLIKAASKDSDSTIKILKIDKNRVFKLIKLSITDQYLEVSV